MIWDAETKDLSVKDCHLSCAAPVIQGMGDEYVQQTQASKSYAAHTCEGSRERESQAYCSLW